jgi:hypothetical protein
MRFFVTDAQLAALQFAAQREGLATVAARFDAELNRQRADHAAELARLADPAGPFVQHLRAEVDFWRIQFMHERQRGEVAIDQCRATHLQIGPVSLPLREDTVARPPARDPFNDPELAAMGDPIGL